MGAFGLIRYRMKNLDIAVAGCGIGGLAAAIVLRRQGHGVTLYEQFAQPRPIGSGLMIQPTGLSVLSQLGLAEQVVTEGAQIDGLLGLNSEGEPALEADYSALPYAHVFGLGVHRANLFAALFETALAAGAVLETSFAIARADIGDGSVRLVDVAGRVSAPHDLLIDGAGVGSPLVEPRDATLPFGALWATVDWPGGEAFNPRLLEQRYAQARRMVGLLPVGKGVGKGSGGQQRAAFFWSLKADELEQWRADGMAAWWDEICRMWPACEVLRAQLVEPEQLVFARYAHRTSAPSKSPRLVHIGDAWHSASPQLGQGANMALLDAWALAQALEREQSLAAALAQFAALRSGHVRLYQALTWAFTPPFQSDSVWPAIVRDLLMAPASRIAPAPRIKAQLVAGLAGNPLERLGLELPDYSALAASSTASRASALPQS